MNEVLSERKERLASAYEVLRRRGLALNHQEVADRMGASRSTVTGAFNGYAQCVTDRFLKRFNKAFGDLFSEAWLLSGDGDMLSPSVSQSVVGDGNTAVAGNGNHVNSEVSRFLDELAAQRRLTESALAQNDRLLSIIENLQK